jgi:hypothetical protein
LVARKNLGGGAVISWIETPKILSGKQVARAKIAEKIQMLMTKIFCRVVGPSPNDRLFASLSDCVASPFCCCVVCCVVGFVDVGCAQGSALLDGVGVEPESPLIPMMPTTDLK